MSESATRYAATRSSEQRLSSGNPGLDTLVGGGFVSGGVYMVLGAPGTGKTTLASQCCYFHAARGQRTIYVSLLAETHGRLIRNLEGLDFFEPQVVGSTVMYVGGYTVLRQQGAAGLLQLIRKLLAEEQPVLLVLDGLSAAISGTDAARAPSEFIAELQVLGDVSACTMLVLSSQAVASGDPAGYSLADGLLELRLEHAGQRTFREVEVLKFRGSDHFLGGHDLEISNRGLLVRPRTELLLARGTRESVRLSETRLSSGIPNLDSMLGGGYLPASSTLVLGFSGSGKTMLGLHFLNAGAAAGEPGLYFGFYEPPARLIEGAQSIGLPLRQYVERGVIGVQWQPALRHGIDALAEQMLTEIAQRKVTRLVIDGLDGLRQSVYHPERTIRVVTALFNELRAAGVTLLLTEETQKLFGPEVEVRIEGISALVDNILLVEYMDVDSELRRLLSVIKQRGSGYDTSIRELCITERGVTLAQDGTSAAEILRGAVLSSEHGRTSLPGRREMSSARR